MDLLIFHESSRFEPASLTLLFLIASFVNERNVPQDYKIISIDPIDKEKVNLFKDRLKGGGWTEGEYGDLKHGKDVLF